MSEPDQYHFNPVEMERLRVYQGAVNAKVFNDMGGPEGSYPEFVVSFARHIEDVLDDFSPVELDIKILEKLSKLRDAVVQGQVAGGTLENNPPISNHKLGDDCGQSCV